MRNKEGRIKEWPEGGWKEGAGWAQVWRSQRTCSSFVAAETQVCVCLVAGPERQAYRVTATSGRLALEVAYRWVTL